MLGRFTFMHALAHKKHKLLLTASFYPLMWLAIFYAFVLRARFHLGYWPAYSHPDPKELDFTAHHFALHFGMLGLPFVPLVAVCFGVASRARSRDVPLWLIIFTALLPVAIAVFVNIEPYDFIGWFLD